jgi:S-DNA-T family DNA segregation ATPase FtsK/SpoIIIE
MVSLFLWFKNPGMSMRRLELVLSSILLFFTLSIFQALLVSNVLRGTMGGSFVDFLSPFIGGAGVWIFWLMSTTLAVMILLDKSLHEVIAALPHFELSRFLPAKKKKETVAKVKNEKYVYAEEENYEEISAYEDESIEESYRYAAEEEESFVPEPPPLYPEYTAAKQEPVIDKKPDSVFAASAIESKKEPEAKTIISLAKKVKEEKHALIIDELEENKQLLDQIEKGVTEKPKKFKLPPTHFLQ